MAVKSALEGLLWEDCERMPVTTAPVRAGFEDPIWLIPRILTKLNSMWVRMCYPFGAIGRGVSIHFTCELRNTGLMEIGDFVTIHKDTWLHAHPAASDANAPVLTIGDHCFIARRCHIAAANHIEIGAHVLFAAGVLVQDHGHSFRDIHVPIREQKPASGGRISIGEGCWIGHGAAIICDSGELALGRNCVIGANAVVTKSAPDYSVLSGNPARIVKQFDPAKGDWVLGSTRTPSNEPRLPEALAGSHDH